MKLTRQQELFLINAGWQHLLGLHIPGKVRKTRSVKIPTMTAEDLAGGEIVKPEWHEVEKPRKKGWTKERLAKFRKTMAARKKNGA